MELTQRKKQILKIVVDSYINTAEPVGSKAIVEQMPGKISSATIRNELADLVEMGYLEQPHTSAGRVPSAKGYRLYVNELMERRALPEAPEAVPAGFPSPSQDYFSGDLDILKRLIRDRNSTFIWTASGDSMTGAQIQDRDLMLVDRGVEATEGVIVIAIVDGEYAVKRLAFTRGLDGARRPILRSENPAYPDIAIAELSELTVWGVVTWVLHPTGRNG